MKTKWPEKSGEYKIVQLLVDGWPLLAFASQANGNHMEILERFLLENQIDYEKKHPFECPILLPGLTEKETMITQLKGQRYTVKGMGWCRVDLINKMAIFFGYSQSYKIGICLEMIPDLEKSEPGWKMMDEYD